MKLDHRLTLVVTGRCMAARLALAAGSLHGASVVCVIRMDAGNMAVIVGKALWGLTNKLLGLFITYHK